MGLGKKLGLLQNITEQEWKQPIGHVQEKHACIWHVTSCEFCWFGYLNAQVIHFSENELRCSHPRPHQALSGQSQRDCESLGITLAHSARSKKYDLATCAACAVLSCWGCLTALAVAEGSLPLLRYGLLSQREVLLVYASCPNQGIRTFERCPFVCLCGAEALNHPKC